MNTMKFNRCLAALFAVMCLFALAGCQLAREDAGDAPKSERLIGALITTEYLDLFDMEGYLNDNLKGFSGGEITIDGDTREYQGRLYAALKERVLTNEETGENTSVHEYVFEGVEGIAYFTAAAPGAGDNSFVTSSSDNAISDGHVGLSYGDDEDKITLEGTIYISPGHGGTFYLNPIYQSADGSVYAVSGSGISMGGVQGEGSVYTQTLDETTTVTENGKSKKQSASIKISLATMLPPEKIVLLQMDSGSAVLSRKEYAPDEVPKTLVPEKGTHYIIVETGKRDPLGAMRVARELFGREDETLSTFSCRDDGICVKTSTQLQWAESQGQNPPA